VLFESILHVDTPLCTYFDVVLTRILTGVLFGIFTAILAGISQEFDVDFDLDFDGNFEVDFEGDFDLIFRFPYGHGWGSERGRKRPNFQRENNDGPDCVQYGLIHQLFDVTKGWRGRWRDAVVW